MAEFLMELNWLLQNLHASALIFSNKGIGITQNPL